MEESDSSASHVAETWLHLLEGMLAGRGGVEFLSLFAERCFWRDMVSMTWDTRQFWGAERVQTELVVRSARVGFSGCALDLTRSPPSFVEGDGKPLIEFFFQFKTRQGTGKGFVRLLGDGSSPCLWRAELLATSLASLDAAPDRQFPHPRLGFDPQEPGQTWSDWVKGKGDFEQKHPDILIIGGSQAGLAVGARLERKGLSYLIVEKNALPGDNWRQRYDALALHTNTPANDLPYLKLPPHWGSFISKDQWADWLDAYVNLMSLNFWGSSEVVRGSFDESLMEWEVELRRQDGQARIMRPKHVVLAIGGVGGKPRIPSLPGLTDFAGSVVHSSAYRSGRSYSGRRVLVVGSSTTAHDICLDLFYKGAEPTMAQRGPTCVVNIEEVQKLTADYSRVHVDEADQRRNANFVLPLLIERTQASTARTEISHAKLHEGLRAAGQKLTIGDDRTGWVMKLFRDLAGYYLNVGCSEAIVDGRVKILDFDKFEGFVKTGVVMRNGQLERFDDVVLATGYEDISKDVASLFGVAIADKVGRGIGMGEDGEYRNMGRPTGQPHLWMMFGGIVDARKSSDFLAMQIAAQLNGIVPSLVRQPDGSSAPFVR